MNTNPTSRGNTPLTTLYDWVTGDEDARVCKDIPEASCHHQPVNFFAYLLANTFTKIADELCSARLILPWLIGALGAPAAFAGFLVPIREAGVLLPQLFIAAFIRKFSVRKWVWILGGLLSAAAIALMIPAIGDISGVAAGWLIIVLLCIYSLARGICSVSAKDVVGKTVSKARRGTLMGYAASASGLTTLAIGLYIQGTDPTNGGSDLFVQLLSGAVACYLVSVIAFATIREQPGATEGGANAFSEAIRSLSIVVTDRQFRAFLVSRTLLLSVALAPPFYVLMAQQNDVALGGLGVLIVANGLAAMVSGPLWGKMSDRSSRRVMALTSLATGVLGVSVFTLTSLELHRFDNLWEVGALFFLIAVCHGGARLGRKTYLVDMATRENRATYVAVSNTLIGGFMLIGGGFGVIGDYFSIGAVIGVLGVISLFGSVYIRRIADVSEG